jgi:hypothetical protein
MPRVPLPPDCAGFSDGDARFMGERGPGSFVHIDDTSPAGAQALAKLRNQEFACAGLADVGPEKFFARRGGDGRWCETCRRTWWRWSLSCPRCGDDTVPEAQIPEGLPAGPYMP